MDPWMTCGRPLAVVGSIGLSAAPADSFAPNIDGVEGNNMEIQKRRTNLDWVTLQHSYS